MNFIIFFPKQLDFRQNILVAWFLPRRLSVTVTFKDMKNNIEFTKSIVSRPIHDLQPTECSGMIPRLINRVGEMPFSEIRGRFPFIPARAKKTARSSSEIMSRSSEPHRRNNVSATLSLNRIWFAEATASVRSAEGREHHRHDLFRRWRDYLYLKMMIKNAKTWPAVSLHFSSSMTLLDNILGSIVKLTSKLYNLVRVIFYAN